MRLVYEMEIISTHVTTFCDELSISPGLKEMPLFERDKDLGLKLKLGLCKIHGPWHRAFCCILKGLW